MNTEKIEKQVDPISKLHELTMRFGQKASDILGKSFVATQELDNANDLSSNPYIQEVCLFCFLVICRLMFLWIPLLTIFWSSIPLLILSKSSIQQKRIFH